MPFEDPNDPLAAVRRMNQQEQARPPDPNRDRLTGRDTAHFLEPSGDPGSYAWDPNTFRPVGLGGPPQGRKEAILAFQYRAEQLAQEARNRYFGAAQDYLSQGRELFERYRPGGAAALSSGLYQGQAQLSFNIGTQQEAPDLLGNYRLQREDEVKRAAERSAKMQLALGVIQAGAGALGAAAGGIPSSPGPTLQPGVQTPGGAANAGLSPVVPGSQPGQGGQALPSIIPGSQPGAGGNYTGPPAGSAPPTGGPGSPGYQQSTLPPGGGGGPQGGPPGGGPGQRRQGDPGGPGGPGGFQTGGGFGGVPFGADGDFSSQGMAMKQSAAVPAASMLTNRLAMAVINPRSWDVIELGVDQAVERAAMLAAV